LYKVITSPVKRWPGTVTISDPLTFPQVFAFEDGLAAMRALGEDTDIRHQFFALLPGVCACVEKWEIQGLPEMVTSETFPATPARASAELANWLIGEVSALFNEAEEAVPLD